MASEIEADHNREPQRSLPRVVVFVTQRQHNRLALLVQQQPDGEAELPHADVELYEEPADASLRLLRNLTGITRPVDIQRIALVRERLPKDTRVMLRPVYLRTGPSFDATLMRFTLDRGLRVRLIEAQDDFARISFEEMALRENELVIATRRFGWVTIDALASRIEHHLFHIKVSNGQIEQATGARTPENLTWAPLDSPPRLTAIHQQWLERARPLLMR